MPQLATHAAIAAHLKQAVADRSRWLFIADGEAGHRAMVGLTLAVHLRGVPEGRTTYECFDWLDTSTGVRGMVSLLTVQKTDLSDGQVSRAIGLVEFRPTDRFGDRHLIPLSTDPARRAGLLRLAAGGELRPAKADPSAN